MFGSQHICDVWKSTEQSIHPSIHQILILGWVVGGTTIKRPPNFAVSLATSFLLWLGFPQSQASVEIESPPTSFACLPACLPGFVLAGHARSTSLGRCAGGSRDWWLYSESLRDCGASQPVSLGDTFSTHVILAMTHRSWQWATEGTKINANFQPFTSAPISSQQCRRANAPPSQL